ncbi:MAG: hypothetical protein L6R42_007366, partial [Xanthoria sp. 1 TBL-2021]
MESIQIPTPQTPMPLLGRSKTTPKANVKAAVSAGGRSSGKSNSSILSFFKKADVSPAKGPQKHEEESLFIDDGELDIMPKGFTQTPTPPRDHEMGTDWFRQGEHPTTRDGSMGYNELEVPNKRRRISTEQSDGSTLEPTIRSGMHVISDLSVQQSEATEKSPNIITEGAAAQSKEPPNTLELSNEVVTAFVEEQDAHGKGVGMTPKFPASTTSVPALKREPTSRGTVLDYDDNDDFIDDEYIEGEEYLERRWMEEQTDLEMGLEYEDQPLGMSAEVDQAKEHRDIPNAEAETSSSCPICG